MMNLDILSSDATQAQIKKNETVVSSKQVAKKAEKTFMNSSIIRNHKLTDTARLDFVLATAFVLSDFNVTTQQVVALAAECKLDSKRLQSASQIAKHCKDNEICSVENSVLSITDSRLQDFYRDAFYSQAHMMQLEKYAAELLSFNIAFIESVETIENAHSQALILNAEFAAQAKKAKAAATRKRKAAAKKSA